MYSSCALEAEINTYGNAILGRSYIADYERVTPLDRKFRVVLALRCNRIIDAECQFARSIKFVAAARNELVHPKVMPVEPVRMRSGEFLPQRQAQELVNRSLEVRNHAVQVLRDLTELDEFFGGVGLREHPRGLMRSTPKPSL